MPACRFAPKCTEDVSRAIAILSESVCKFAVRGGGHMSWAGAANIQDGVTIDLGLMKDVTVSRDSKTTSVGSGARWQDVYLKLDAMNLSVAGGRVYDVGVGGLLLGGESLQHCSQAEFMQLTRSFRRKLLFCITIWIRL